MSAMTVAASVATRVALRMLTPAGGTLMASWLVISALLGSDHPAMDDRQRDDAGCC